MGERLNPELDAVREDDWVISVSLIPTDYGDHRRRKALLEAISGDCAVMSWNNKQDLLNFMFNRPKMTERAAVMSGIEKIWSALETAGLDLYGVESATLSSRAETEDDLPARNVTQYVMDIEDELDKIREDADKPLFSED